MVEDGDVAKVTDGDGARAKSGVPEPRRVQSESWVMISVSHMLEKFEDSHWGFLVTAFA